ncbi:hypothetical protein ANAPC5_00982 [Anaplasma phagocytophilum]|nr:hypothetical protein ANAPC2_00891 [Anaplasma phagocytophilum]SBO33268.1 hypothetical protein ANAPC4_01096 [Anaplasma phagocytophilum]SCV64861.1 hypothetical protein ANAPC5_00982 [Anaplasma phagocytophilum]
MSLNFFYVILRASANVTISSNTRLALLVCIASVEFFSRSSSKFGLTKFTSWSRILL